MTVEVFLALFSLACFLGVALVIVCACVCGARDDRLLAAWRAERERAQAGLDERFPTLGEGWRN